MKVNKKIRILVSILILALSIQIPAFALPSNFGVDNATPVIQNETESIKKDKIKIIDEDVTLRDEDTKHFVLSDGSYIAAHYNTAVHYLDNNVWKDIDNSFTLQDAVDSNDIKGFINTSSNIKYKFANNSSCKKLFRIKTADYEISWSLNSANKGIAPTIKNGKKLGGDSLEEQMALDKAVSSVVYENILDNTDIEYIVSGNNIKENIVVKKPNSKYEYTFTLKLKSLTPEISENGSVVFVNNLGKTVFSIPTPYMFDAEGDSSEDVTYSISAQRGRGKYTLTVSADSEWINNAQFPVTIDPTIIHENAQKYFDSSYFHSGKADAHLENTNIYVGKRDGKSHRGYIKVLKLPSLRDTDIVIDSTLYIMQVGSLFDSSSDSKILTIHQAKPRQGKYPTWNDCPFEENALDYNKRVIDNNYFLAFDITSAVKDWYRDSSTNYGLILKGEAENSSANRAYMRFCNERSTGSTAMLPKYSVTYINTRGLEPTQSYHSASAGVAGTGYTNDHSGFLTWMTPDFIGSGSRMPVSISHIYNIGADTDDSYFTNFYNIEMKSGKGWKLNVQEKVRNVTQAGGSSLHNTDANYIYTDSDGTEHYFNKKSTSGSKITYISTVLTDYELVRDSSSSSVKFYITNTKSHIKRTFDKDGYFLKIEDANGNTETISYYPNSHRIKCVTDGAGRSYTFKYNNDDTVSRITAPDGRYNTYVYSPEGNLLKIEYRTDSGNVYNTAVFTYDGSGNLVSARDSDSDYQINYTYDDLRRVVLVQESAGTKNGIKMGIRYNGNASTTFHTAGGDDVYIEEDNTGFRPSDDKLITYGFNYYGQCIVSYTTDAKGSTLFGASSAAYQNEDGITLGNKMTESSAIGMSNSNIMIDPEMEKTPSLDCALGINGATTPTVTLNTTEKYSLNSSYLLKPAAPYGEHKIAALKRNAYTIFPYSKITLSAYVKPQGEFGDNSGVVLGFVTSSGAIFAKSAPYSDFSIASLDNGWKRISFTFKPTVQKRVYPFIGVENSSVPIFIDNVQLELGDLTYYSSLANGGFYNSTASWIKTPENSTAITVKTDSEVPSDNGFVPSFNALKIEGAPSLALGVSQTVTVNEDVKETFILSGWGKAESVKTCTEEESSNYKSSNLKNCVGDRRFRLKAEVSYDYKTDKGGTGTETENIYVPFNYQYSGWQFVSKPLVIKPAKGRTVTKINTVKVSCEYNNNINTAYFADISLVRDLAQSYSYDKDGNPISAQALKDQKSGFEYNKSNDLIKETTATGVTYNYTYDAKHNLTSSQSSTGIKETYTYDEYGNVLSSTASSVNNNNLAITAANGYSSDGNYRISVTDSRGKTTRNNIELSSGLLLSVISPNGTHTEYTYDDENRQTGVTVKSDNTDSATTLGSVEYAYSLQNQLKNIYTDSSLFTFTFDDFGNRLSTQVGNRTLATYAYASNNGKLRSQSYGNGQTLSYSYDGFGRVSKKKFTDTDFYTYLYDGNGNLTAVKNASDLVLRANYYDTIGRLISFENKADGTNALDFFGKISYDKYSRLNEVIYGSGNSKQVYNYEYNTDNFITKETYFKDGNTSAACTIDYTYDGLKRLKDKSYTIPGAGQNLKYSYTYLNAAGNETPLLSGFSIVNDTTVYALQYDDVGNIISDSKSLGPIPEGGTYVYDKLNQLVRANSTSANKTYTYTYDGSGNITSVKEYTYTTGSLDGVSPIKTVNYVYNDASWGDLLTNYDGQTITYDNIGNPLTYRDGLSFTWTRGRTLSEICRNGNAFVSYAYDDNGIRTEKNVNGVKTLFGYNGSTLLYQKTGDILISFIYEADGSPLGFTYGEDTYYYRKNMHGDITGIYNSSLTPVAYYQYDPWGKIVAVLDGNKTDVSTNPNHIANINPLRYRGYYYDNETGFYYLQSRYYDTTTERFINADGLVSTGQGVLGYNMFAYCGNNSISRVDSSGTSAVAIGTLVGSGLAYKLIEAVLVIGISILSTISVKNRVDEYNNIFSKNKVEEKAEEKDEKKKKEDAPTYYQVTIWENALKIKAKEYLTGSKWESGFVFAWKIKPTIRAIKYSGAKGNVLISFKTNASFVPDDGLSENDVARACLPVVSARPGPIKVWDVRIEGIVC